MRYLSLSIYCPDAEQQEVVNALLPGGEGVEYKDRELVAYFKEETFPLHDIEKLMKSLGLSYRINELAHKNWNQEWEKFFPPIEIDRFCRIRAEFHEPKDHFLHELVIHPKMSFGTGHHETTRMMIRLMSGLDFRNKIALDFGCGTGILGILAAKMGAKQVKAMDIESWSVENSRENAKINGISNLEAQEGGMDVFNSLRFNIILANINRNVLLDSFSTLKELLLPQGLLLISGFLKDDLDSIKRATQKLQFKLIDQLQEAAWIAQKLKVID